ncbi:winged helix-turn-helix domain-containing protein [Shewanella waksmanii]|uniref:winged helix-turn-helix domain-containing protein n=1 Tax=Shewanella waksmanii TaxID=213783 RepID=UPI000491E3B1|nr:winged helix-turn-helix domain-containing protein [Shewanella waksmanii]
MLPEKRFLLSDRLVDPNHCTISFADAVNKIELRAMQVLLCLIEHAGKPVSRDMLIETVWRGGHISDNAINRIIGLLRNQLGDNAKSPQFIKTVPKVGYVLICHVSEVEETEKERVLTKLSQKESQHSHVKSWKNRVFFSLYQHTSLYVGLLAAFVISIVYVLASMPPSSMPPVVAKVLPLTFLEGQEFAPSLSPDGEFLVFSHRTEEQVDWRLGLMNMNSREISFLSGTFENANYPSFSPDGKNVAYIGFNSSGECEIRIVAIENGYFAESRTVTQCKQNSVGSSIAWHPSGMSLYYTDEDASNKHMSAKLVFSISINGKDKRQLSQPFNVGRGDYAISVSPDGKKLAVIRNVKWFQSVVMLFSLDKGSWETLFTVDYPLNSIMWGSNSDTLTYRSMSGHLNQFDLNTKEDVEVALVSQRISRPMSNLMGEVVAVAGNYYSSEIWKIDNPFKALNDQITSARFIYSSSSDSGGVASSKGDIAFLSSRSGIPQVWLKRQSGSEVQISNFERYGIIRQIGFSNESNRLLGTFNSEVFIYDFDSKKLNFVKGLDNVFGVSWGEFDSQIIVSRENIGNWSLEIFDIEENKVVRALSEDGIYGRYDPESNSYFYNEKNDNSLWQLKGDEKKLVHPDFKITHATSWLVNHQAVYRVNATLSGSVIQRLDFETGEIQSIDLASEPFQMNGLSVTSDGGILVNKVSMGAMDVVGIEFGGS